MPGEYTRCVTVYPPMLDIIAYETEEFLKTQGIQLNTIVGYCENKHKNISDNMLKRIEEKDSTVSFFAGGATYNTQKILSKWMECIFFGVIGKDNYGIILERLLEKKRISIYLDKSKHFSTQWAYVFLSGDKRTVIAKQDSSIECSPEMQKKINASIGKDTIFYFVSFTFFLKNIAQHALSIMNRRKEIGVLCIINLSSEEIIKTYREQILEAVKHADFLIGNKAEFYTLFNGPAKEELLLKWLDTLGVAYAITNGPEETIGRIPGGSIGRITPPSISKEINTNGAGDSFAAGFISALRNRNFEKICCILPLLQAGTHASFEYIIHNRATSEG